MAKPRTEQYRFQIPLYTASVLLIRSTPKEYLRILARYSANVTEEEDGPTGDGSSSLLTHAEQPPIILIWVAERAELTRPYWVGIVAHECWHGVWRFAREIGLSANIATESVGEAHAYLHGWLVEQCVTRLHRRSRRTRAGRRKK